MVVGGYIPERGHIVWLSFSPSLGHEQAGRRPALVLSPRGYNRKTDIVICCPVTRSVKGYSFEVEILVNKETGIVLVDQIRSLDWSRRNCEFIDRVSEEQLLEVQDKLIELVKG